MFSLMTPPPQPRMQTTFQRAWGSPQPAFSLEKGSAGSLPAQAGCQPAIAPRRAKSSRLDSVSSIFERYRRFFELRNPFFQRTRSLRERANRLLGRASRFLDQANWLFERVNRLFEPFSRRSCLRDTDLRDRRVLKSGRPASSGINRHASVHRSASFPELLRPSKSAD
jgi:hypothetical protein